MDELVHNFAATEFLSLSLSKIHGSQVNTQLNPAKLIKTELNQMKTQQNPVKPSKTR